jgi:leucyl aminopeptidase
MKIQFSDHRPTGAYALVVPASSAKPAALDTLGEGAAAVESALKRQRFDGEPGSTAEAFDAAEGRRLLVVGLGKLKNGEAAERLGGTTAARLIASGEIHAVIDLDGLDLDADSAARVALAAVLRGWRYDRYRTRLKEKQKPTLARITIVGGGSAAAERWAARYAPLAEGVALARELVTEPANIVYPESFVSRVKANTDGLGLDIEVMNGPAMAKLGMGALLGVAQGSVREPRLLVLRWNGGAKDERPIALLGKGVTFDTGGISIKPALGMESMKWDMGGAAAVVGAMKALAMRKAKANVIGVCGLVENMPDGNAQRPGDVVTSMSGQTIEVINTDAEGRLVLCDLMTWVQRTHKPRMMVDLATLTGAMVISLGHEYAGIFANDDELAAKLIEAGEATGDKLWRQPLGEAYDRLIDSDIADMKNVGPRPAGSITAAQFLQRFVEDDTKWAHLDIAGMAWSDKDKTTYGKGATGFGVRLLEQFVADVAEVG